MYKHFFKRLFDFVVALVALPFFLIIFIFLAPIIWLTDRGPVFYVAERLGRRGKTFKMIKFRSMRVNSPNLLNADGSTYNGDNDPRVTPIGRFIRKTSLDETPQILNILVGHMSIIGPRAHLTTNYKGYAWSYLAFWDGPHFFRQDFSCPDVLWILLRSLTVSSTGLSPSLINLSKLFDYNC